MIKFSTSLLAVFLLILLGGESYANEELDEDERSDLATRLADAIEAQRQIDEADTDVEREEAARELERVEQEIVDFYPDLTTDQLIEIITEHSEIIESPEEERQIFQTIANREKCGSGFFSFFCRITSDKTTEAELRSARFKNTYEEETQNINDYKKKNSINIELMNNDIRSLIGEDFSDCNSPNSNCREAIRNHCSSTNCGENEDSALKIHQVAADNYLIPKSGMMRAAEFLQVSPGAFAAADTIQDLLGFEFSLVEEGSGVDQILSYGTPEQVCYAKVDSFIDVNGVEVEGQEVEVADEVSGMTSRIKACDNKDFDICADLRAERSDMYFNNSFTLVVHFYVYNAKDHKQEVVLNAEFFDEEGNKDTFNVFNRSSEEIVNGTIILESGQRESLSLQIPNLQVFEGQDIEELYGNVLLSVFKKSSEETSLLIEENLDFAIDYPIMKMSGGESVSKEEKEKQVENSGAEATDGTTTGTSSLIDRVSLS